ncbi:MAG TPA: TonB-dependent receptor [Novosphingobium sp.]|nr:TonB-dependent receptor [Novosphingobium sp.]
MRPTIMIHAGYRAELLTCSALAILACAASPAVAQSSSVEATGLEEIVVTAQKREQSLQDVPISITAVTQETLEANRVTNVLNLGAMAPNVTVKATRGNSGLPQITIRGIVNRSGASIPMYLDGVLIGGSRGVAFEIPDIERIEVLRGPQGTLFGRNSTGGALSIVSRDPVGEFGLRQQFTYGNYDQFRSSTRIDSPQIGPFSATISYTHDERRGETKNLGAGTTWYKNVPGLGAMVSPKWLGNKNAESVFVAIKFEPSDTFNMVYKYDYTQNHFTPEGYGYLVFTPNDRYGAVNGPKVQQIVTAGGNVAHARRPKEVNNWYTVPGHSNAKGHNLTANLQVSDNFSLKNITGYRESFIYAASGIGGEGNVINTFPELGPVGAPLVFFGVESYGKNKQFSNELLANYDSKLVTLTLGAQYLYLRQEFGSPDGIGSASLGFIPNFTLPLGTRSFTIESAKSWAGFGQAEIHVTPQIDVIGGYRITRDHKYGAPMVRNLPVPFDYKATKSTFSLGANYKPTDEIMLYVKYSTGYVAGGASADFAYAPETVKSWEVGFKGDLLDNRLRLNVVAWRAKYLNLQTGTLGVNVGRPDLSGVTVAQGDELAKGAEVEVTVLPVEGLTFNGGLGYTDAKLTRLNPIFGQLANFRLTQMADWTANLSAQYDTQPLWGDARLSIRADAQWKSKMPVIGTIPVAPAYVDAQYVKASWIVNGRVALKGLDLAGSDAEIAVWARNLFDNDLPAFPIASGVPPYLSSGNYEAARTFGVDVTFNY